MYKLFAYAAFSLAVLTSASLGDTTHKVRKGETLSSIAATYRVTVTAIKNANNIRNANKIRIGQTLSIPADAVSFKEYKIRKGDNLSDIASQHNVSLSQLTAYNNIRNANQIRVGQIIKIPIQGAAARARYLYLSERNKRALDDIAPRNGQWKHIVIHHSASKSGSAKSFDRFHREERHMENGLAYHFVIGNGNGMGDGEVHIGDRWKRQIQGGHMSSYAQNQISIGICLVGNFETNRPTEKQLEQLESLIEYLMEKTKIPSSRVTTHTLLHPKHTVCPGRYFPSIASFRKRLD